MLGVANAVFALPLLFLAISLPPERLEVAVVAPQGTVMRMGTVSAAGVEYSRYVSATGQPGEQVLKIYSNDPFDRDRLALSFAAEKPVEIVAVSVLSHLFIRHTLSSAEFARRYRLKGDVYVPRDGTPSAWPVRIGSDRRLWFGLIGLELLLLLFCGITFTVRTGCSNRLNLMISGSVAGVAGLFTFVVVPLQSYLANRADFPFSVGEFALESACLFVGMAAILTPVLYFSERLLGRLPHLLTMAFVLYEYLETGILAAGQPQLNGEIWYFENAARQQTDTLILAGVILAMLVAYRWLKDKLHYVAWILIVLSVASLFDVKVGRQADGVPSDFPAARSKMDVVKSVSFSPRRNILMFILDSMTSRSAHDVLSSDDPLRRSFAGFTSFTNNVGMGPYTDSGLPGLMIGIYQEEWRGKSDFGSAMYSEKSFLSAYLEKGVSVAFLPMLANNGYGVSTFQQKGGRANVSVRRGWPFRDVRKRCRI